VAVRPVSDQGATIEVCVVTRRDETSPVVLRFLDCAAGLFPPSRTAAAGTVSAAVATSVRRVG
jgi:hypothetical protein